MTAALTLLIILAVSLVVVRIGGTALRLTGMPLDVARFQSISALTGTGFTTQEAETTMHHPLRRRVLIGLMFAGHLGVVSLASTVILAGFYRIRRRCSMDRPLHASCRFCYLRHRNE